MYQKKETELSKLYNKYNNRREEAEMRDEGAKKVTDFTDKIKSKIATWKESKPWITEDEAKDVLEKV